MLGTARGRNYLTPIVSVFLAILAVLPCAAEAASAAPAKTLKSISYPSAAATARRQSLDLYLPAAAYGKPPLLIFVHGGFWLLSDDEYRLGEKVAAALVNEGIAVALVRYRLAGEARHPAQADDVAAGIALLIRDAQKYGYDGKRIFLAGHSAGGHLAALVALDGRYLGKHRLNAGALAGVIGFSGMYDLLPQWSISPNQKDAIASAFGNDPALLRQISPVHYVRAGAPPFLVLAAQKDFAGFFEDAKRFTDRLNQAGRNQAERWIAQGQDHFTLLDLGDRGNEARLLLFDFMKVEPPPREYAMFMEAKRRWREPPFSTVPFWRHEKLIKSYPIDRSFIDRMVVVYDQLRYELLAWPLQKYHAIDLFEFLRALPPDKAGRGDYLVTTNIRNEKQYWRRDQIEPFKPVIVVGLDDEKNLFRLGVMYRALREYSWKSGEQPPMMARPLGGFIHFLKPPPAPLAMQAAQFALTVESFRWQADDPLAGLASLPKPLFETITVHNGCVYCHQLKGIGSRSHHRAAASGAAHGGEALALEDYPPEVWRNFVFDQVNVAKKIGASPNVVPEAVRQDLFELVNRSRQERIGKK